MRPLDSLNAGVEARLVAIGGELGFRRRLMELGLLPGTVVRLVRKVDVGGVLELEVRRCRLTLRCGEASHLLVSPLA